MQEPQEADADVAAARSMNRDAAQLALDEARRCFDQGQLDEAVKKAKRSYRLFPLPEAAALLQEALQRMRAPGSQYCAECHRLRSNCACGTDGSRRSGSINTGSAAVAFNAVGSAISWLMATSSRTHATVKSFLEERVKVKRNYADSIALIVLLVPVLAAIRLFFLRDQSIMSWVFAPPTPIYRYSSSSSTYHHANARRFASGHGESASYSSEDLLRAGHGSGGSSGSGGGFTFQVSSSILPSILLTVAVNLFLWLARRNEAGAAAVPAR